MRFGDKWDIDWTAWIILFENSDQNPIIDDYFKNIDKFNKRQKHEWSKFKQMSKNLWEIIIMQKCSL